MRRTEKEISDRKIIDDILARSVICRLAIPDKQSPYIVPMNYGYSEGRLYFHSAPEGRKIELLRNDPLVSFEIEDYHRIIRADTPCGWTTSYRSVMGTGKIDIISNPDEIKKGLDIIMSQHGKCGENVYSEAHINKVVILCLSINTISCKHSGDNAQAMNRVLFEKLKQIRVLGDTGLLYQENPFDRERYSFIRNLSLEAMSELTHHSVDEINISLPPVIDYPTPKVDVRALVINSENMILMVREKTDGKWTLPGGWADVGLSASESVVKEVREEAGLEVEATRLLALYDKKCYPHPPSVYYIYKLVFLCRCKGGRLSPGFDILEAGWFKPGYLPELSEDRILAGQIRHLISLATTASPETFFD